MVNITIDKAMKRYRDHLGLEGADIGERAEQHIRSLLRNRTYIRVESELKVTYKEMDEMLMTEVKRDEILMGEN